MRNIAETPPGATGGGRKCDLVGTLITSEETKSALKNQAKSLAAVIAAVDPVALAALLLLWEGGR